MGQSTVMYEGRQTSILIVDDDSENCNRWRAALENAGFRILAADSRLAALAHLGDTASEIELLIIGGLRDGAQLALEAFELRRDLPMIIIASFANPVGIRSELAILLEPVSDAELVGTVRALLSRSSGSNLAVE
jgi:DNA-binding response OmpR family regulator